MRLWSISACTGRKAKIWIQFVLFFLVSRLFRNILWNGDQAGYWICFSIIITSFLCNLHFELISWFWRYLQETLSVGDLLIQRACVWVHMLNGNCSPHKMGRRQILSLQLPWKLTQSCRGKFTHKDFMDLVILPVPSDANSVWCCC